MSFISFDDAVRNICNAGGDPDAKYYSRIARMLRMEIKSMNLLILPTGVRTVRMKVGDSLTIPLENDVVKVDAMSKIENGKLLPMRNMEVIGSDILQPCTCQQPDVEENPALSLDPLCPYHSYYAFYSCAWLRGGTIYGLYTPYVVGGWMHDVQHARINVTGIKAGDVVAAKIRTSKDELTLVPVAAYNMLESMVLHKFFMSSNVGASRSWRDKFTSDLQYYKEQANVWDWDEIYDSIYGTAKRAKH